MLAKLLLLSLPLLAIAAPSPAPAPADEASTENPDVQKLKDANLLVLGDPEEQDRCSRVAVINIKKNYAVEKGYRYGEEEPDKTKSGPAENTRWKNEFHGDGYLAAFMDDTLSDLKGGGYAIPDRVKSLNDVLFNKTITEPVDGVLIQYTWDCY